jgi:hypothetical protein
VAIIGTVFAAMLLTCLGIALALLGSAASTLALRDGQAVDASYAAQAALNLASADVRARTDWSGVTADGSPSDVSAAPGVFVDAMLPRSPWDGSSLDLHVLTSQRQAESDAAAPPGIAGPVWRLFEYGPISRVVPSEARRHQLYVVVWAAGGRDGRLILHATALGASGLRASAETSLRPPAGTAPALRQATRTVW